VHLPKGELGKLPMEDAEGSSLSICDWIPYPRFGTRAMEGRSSRDRACEKLDEVFGLQKPQAGFVQLNIELFKAGILISHSNHPFLVRVCENNSPRIGQLGSEADSALTGSGIFSNQTSAPGSSDPRKENW